MWAKYMLIWRALQRVGSIKDARSVISYARGGGGGDSRSDPIEL